MSPSQEGNNTMQNSEYTNCGMLHMHPFCNAYSVWIRSCSLERHRYVENNKLRGQEFAKSEMAISFPPFLAYATQVWRAWPCVLQARKTNYSYLKTLLNKPIYLSFRLYFVLVIHQFNKSTSSYNYRVNSKESLSLQL